MKNRLSFDQTHKLHTYQLFNANCVNYAKSIAELGGIYFPSEVHLGELVLGSLIGYESLERVHKVTRRAFKGCPSWMKGFAIFLWTIFFNAFGVAFGASMIDKEVRLQISSL